MKRLMSLLLLSILLIFPNISSHAEETVNAPEVIIDTDFASDADDVVALELAMCYQDLGLIDVKGVALSTTYSRSPAAVKAVLSQGRYGYIPVAMSTSNTVQVHTEYVNSIYEYGYNNYVDPVKLYRRILAESTGKVNIITLGFLQNIEDLINSGADQYSYLSGSELIKEKVDTLYIVGGNLDGRPSFNFYWGDGRSTTDAAQYVNNNFPARIVYFTEEMGNDVFCGGFYAKEDNRENNIITKALKSNKQEYGVVAWDPFAVFCMVQDMYDVLDQYNIELRNGSAYISHTGSFSWTDFGEVYSGRQIFIKNRYGGDYNQYLNGMLYTKFKTE